ncbi:Protein kinase domain [Macleaya cordata]|uniref:non-specific serine/threonine protein kinase n=1 Tax=Macleaya cordata TaxID=56857 RepID=A0A200RDV4_MACCD|nr:Protein kinase domain [Macleaya cordata]
MYFSTPLRFSFFGLLLHLLLPIFSIAQVYRNVSLGSSLTASISNNDSWSSPAGEFAFGFRPLENDQFLLAIWFDKIPDRTVVWYANGNQAAPRGSKVELTTEGRLVLTSPQGKELWKPEELVNTGAVRYAAMLDNGNFVLASGNSSDYSWESFKQPTDTILPTQIMETNGVLYSRQTENSYSRGRFRLRLPADNGNFVLNPVAYPSLTENNYDAYYNLTWILGSVPINIRRFVFNKSGDIYLVRKNGSILTLTWDNIVPATDVYYRATLDFDGVFTQYSHPRTSNGTSQRWSIVRSIPDNICDSIIGRLGSGACGYNSYCILTTEKRPSCACPPGYVFVDSNNKFGDCRPNFILPGCQEEESRNPEDLFELKTLKNTDWPTSDYDGLQSYNEQDCRSSCLNDCLCAVALFREGTCWKKKLPLPNGRLDPSVNGNALIKLRKDGNFSAQPSPSSPFLETKKDRSTLILVGSVLLGSSVFFNFLFLAAIFLVFFFMEKRLRKNNQGSSVLRSNLHSFTYKDLEEATGGFKEELGRGSFGIVYKGVTEEMGLRNYIAVKKLDKVFREGEKEFKTEVNVIGQTHHKNLVRLLGFCEEGQNRLLVYEFMSNSSLAEHLFGISKPDWNQRVQIAFGISRGLMYLQEE